MRDHRKRSRIFQYCKSMEVDCVCLQETHILEEDVPLWAYEWGGELHASFGSSSSCGTVILLSARQAGCATRVETDHEGRLVCILFKYPQGNIAICNVYAPNRPSAKDEIFLTRCLPLFLTYLDEKYHGARVRARVEAVEAEERPSLRFYQSVSSSAGDRRVPSVALLMGPWLVTLTALSAYIKSIFEFVYAWQCRLVGTGDLLRGISKTVPHDVNDILGGE
ncbi:pol-like protein [Apostichopus japonicus]|uniref:Pol-like protein n=1 Tax=Stichopus japonicus TaxID=307972 RepID=A0A2G8KPY7_STIJA|nr:pol-like protein [Apostichopus japonicus]